MSSLFNVIRFVCVVVLNFFLPATWQCIYYMLITKKMSFIFIPFDNRSSIVKKTSICG